MSQQSAPSSNHALTNLIGYCADFLEAAGRHSLASLHFRHSAARRGYLDVARLTCDEQLLFPEAGSSVVDPKRTVEASLPDVGISFGDSISHRSQPGLRHPQHPRHLAADAAVLQADRGAPSRARAAAYSDRHRPAAQVLHLLQGEGEFIRLPRELVVAPSFVQIIEYQTIREQTSPPGQYRISRASGIAVMRRSSVFALQDLQAMRGMDPSRLENSLVRRLVRKPEPGPSEEPGSMAGDRSLMGNGEVLFPFSTNQQQIDIAYAIEQNEMVVVDGPPGTGKSQTLANLAVHLAARGRRVLLVSE